VTSRPTLASGTRLGPYEVLALLGAGGMGEVYRARDTRLRRDVAIKVVSADLTRGDEACQRFEREARAVAALSHPNILAIHDVGSANGRVYAVMELLEGETLRARLERGALPWRKAVQIAVAIAEGLAAAHAKGIVHRDLKPANMFLTSDGRVKVLDFGLAKLREPLDPAHSASPTLSHTDPARVLGTVGYMSPEQVAARAVDARSDLFALGCVLYEMVSGQRAFARRTAPEAMAAIINEEPPELSDGPPELRRMLAHCLEKDPEARFQSARDLAFHLRTLLEPASPAGTSAGTASTRQIQERLAWLAAATAAIVALAQFGLSLRSRNQATPMVLSYAPPPEDTVFCLDCGVAVSPGGRHVAFVAGAPGGKPRLWVQPLAGPAAQPLAGTEDARHPFWSPDGRLLGFFAGGRLIKIDASGGVPQVLCEATMVPTGATWSRDGVIVFSGHPTAPLYRIPASGGLPAPVTELDRSRKEFKHGWPAFLPDGSHFLYFAWSANPETTGIYAAALDRKPPTFILRSTSGAVYAAPGYLLFLQAGALLAAPFDEKRLRVTGEPIPIAGRVRTLAASGSDLLVYARGPAVGQLVWLDQRGREVEALPIHGDFYFPKLSHDARRVAAVNVDPQTGTEDIWVYDLSRSVGTRLTFDPASDLLPLWSPDDARIIFSSNRRGLYDIYQVRSSAPGTEELLFATDKHKNATSWSQDGRHVIFFTNAPGQHLWSLSLPDRKPSLLTPTSFKEWDGVISADSRWIAYSSDETGKPEVYVQAFPSTRAKWRISADGGLWPKWRGDGKELFYIASESKKLMAVNVSPGRAFEVSVPRALFDATMIRGPHFDVTADGQRFLVNKMGREEGAVPITLVQNWRALLAK
jgi:Tol biopolymer transport system component